MCRRDQSPLHLAVINDDFALIEQLKDVPELVLGKNKLGFTPVELASLLAKQKALELLLPQHNQPIAIQKKGDSAIRQYSRDEFEAAFSLRYLPAPYFKSVELLEEAVANCPWLLLHTVAGQEHRNLGSVLHKSLFSGKVADVAIRWIDDEMGYGLYAKNLIAKETFIGQYTGEVCRVGRFKTPQNGYCMHMPTRFWSLRYFVIDAEHAGNELRFANHSEEPCMRPYCLVDRSLVHVGFFASRQIEPGEELTFNYGKDYWKHRLSKKK